MARKADRDPSPKKPAKRAARKYPTTPEPRSRLTLRDEREPDMQASSTQTLYARMGQLVGHRVTSESDLVALVTTGLSPKSVGTLKKAVDLDTDLVAPETTLRRRLQENRPLSTDESERIIRIARITSLAEGLFGDRELAHEWLNTPAEFLPGRDPLTPMALASTDPGARLLESLILGTEHGMF